MPQKIPSAQSAPFHNVRPRTFPPDEPDFLAEAVQFPQEMHQAALLLGAQEVVRGVEVADQHAGQRVAERLAEHVAAA